jgi:hypothetical protein
LTQTPHRIDARGDVGRRLGGGTAGGSTTHPAGEFLFSDDFERDNSFVTFAPRQGNIRFSGRQVGCAKLLFDMTIRQIFRNLLLEVLRGLNHGRFIA